MTVQSRLIYAIGLDPLVARAMYADLGGACIRRRRPLSNGGPLRRIGRRPDLVLLDLGLPGVQRELDAARAAWGEELLIVGVSRVDPLARVWQSERLAALVEVGPGFLPALLG